LIIRTKSANTLNVKIMDQHVITPVTFVKANVAANPLLQQALDLFALPFNDLLFQAQQVHRAHHDANSVQQLTPGVNKLRLSATREIMGFLVNVYQ
jgi:hypothetical protein